MSQPLRCATRRRALLEEVGRRVPQPVDVLEIAAVIESIGVTDLVAAEDYCASSSFELAEQIFPLVLSRAVARVHAGHEPEDPNLAERDAEPPALLDASARGLLALAPLGLLVGALQALVAAGWSTGSVLALSFGVTAAMLLTSGPILAIGRRTAVYVGFGYRTSARRFITLSSFVTLIGCWALDAVGLGVSSALGLFSAPQRVIFTASLAAYALLWLLAAGLILAGSARLVVGVLAGGLALGVGVGLLQGTTAGLTFGYGGIVGALAIAWGMRYPSDDEAAVRLPSAGLALVEATPYVAFGSVFTFFLLEPHVLGWLGASSVDSLQRMTTLELSLLLALPPVLFATGVNERIMRRFWTFAMERQRGEDAAGFRREVTQFHHRGLLRYVLALGALSLAAAAGFELAIFTGGLENASTFVFTCGLAGFFLLGIGQFNCFFMLSLALPERALEALLEGLLVLSVLGTFSLIDFRLATLAFALGAAAFASASFAGCQAVLREAPHRYATAF